MAFCTAGPCQMSAVWPLVGADAQEARVGLAPSGGSACTGRSSRALGLLSIETSIGFQFHPRPTCSALQRKQASVAVEQGSLVTRFSVLPTPGGEECMPR